MRKPKTDGPGDEDLIARIAVGDGPAFRVLSDRYTGLIHALAFRMTFSRTTAEDIVQETWLRVWKDARRWKPDGGASVKTWLCRIAGNVSIDSLRRDKGGSSVDLDSIPDRGRGADGMLEDRERGAIVGSALRNLPDRQRAALVLFHYEGLSVAEVAQAIGVTEKAAEGLLGRARTALRKKLEKYEGVL